MRKVIAWVALAMLGSGAVALVRAADEPASEAKYEIKEVMKQAHADKLLNKVLDGQATLEDKAKLLDLYLSLLENKPPKGDEESWHKLAGGVVIAAAKVTAGREGAVEELKAATKCQTCHMVHKPS